MPPHPYNNKKLFLRLFLNLSLKLSLEFCLNSSLKLSLMIFNFHMKSQHCMMVVGGVGGGGGCSGGWRWLWFNVIFISNQA